MLLRETEREWERAWHAEVAAPRRRVAPPLIHAVSDSRRMSVPPSCSEPAARPRPRSRSRRTRWRGRCSSSRRPSAASCASSSRTSRCALPRLAPPLRSLALPALCANPRLVFCGAAALTIALAIGARQLGRAYFSVPYAVVGDGGDAGTVPYGEQADTQVAASAPPPPLSVVTSVARAHCTAVL